MYLRVSKNKGYAPEPRRILNRVYEPHRLNIQRILNLISRSPARVTF